MFSSAVGSYMLHVSYLLLLDLVDLVQLYVQWVPVPAT